jgi:SPP1 gp7 family putative phage head morphogenesis protein
MPRRPRAQADLFADEATTHAWKILRLAASHRATALEFLTDLELELARLIERFTPSTAKAARLREFQADTAAIIRDIYKRIAKTHTKDLAALASVEGLATANALNKSIGVAVVKNTLTPELIAQVIQEPVILGHQAREWWAGQDQDLRRKFAAQMAMGQAIGETNEQLVARVRGTKAANFNNGIMAVKRREAEALVRTSAIATSNTARLKGLEEMGPMVKAIQWISTLDSRTTHICKALDGLQWTLPGYKPKGHDKAFPGPTAHWNCRSTQIAVTPSWEELSGKKLKALDDRTLQQAIDDRLAEEGKTPEQIAGAKARARASMDGQVAKSYDFEEWADGKGESFLSEVLGPGRAELYKSGAITFSDLTDQNNRPLTIEELKASFGK